MNQEIKRIIESYSSIIDLEDSKEVMHLIADLDELMRSKLTVKDKIANLYEELNKIPENKRYNLGSKGVDIINKIHKLHLGG